MVLLFFVVDHGLFKKEMFLTISQNSQKNTSARASLLIKLQASGLQLLYKRGSGTGVFLWILQNFQEHLFHWTPPVAASAYWKFITSTLKGK